MEFVDIDIGGVVERGKLDAHEIVRHTAVDAHLAILFYEISGVVDEGVAAETGREDDHDERDRKSRVKGAILVRAFLFAHFAKPRHIRHNDRYIVGATVLKGGGDQFIGAMLCIALPAHDRFNRVVRDHGA